VIEAEKPALRGVTDVRAAGGVALRVLQIAASPAKAGYLFIGSRADDTIIRSGKNIAPAEIEEVLVEHDDVRACAVVGAEDPECGQVITASSFRTRDPIPTRANPAVRTLAPARLPYARPGPCFARTCRPTPQASCPTRSGRRGLFGAILIGACFPRCVHRWGAELSRPAVSLRCGWR